MKIRIGALSFYLFVAAMVAYAISLNQKIKTLELSIENERLTREYNDKKIEYKLESYIFNRHKEWTPVSNAGSKMDVDMKEMFQKIIRNDVTKADIEHIEKAIKYCKDMEAQLKVEKL